MLQQGPGAFRDLGKDWSKKLAEQQRAQGEWTHSVHGEAMQGRGSHRNFLRCLLLRKSPFLKTDLSASTCSHVHSSAGRNEDERLLHKRANKALA